MLTIDHAERRFRYDETTGNLYWLPRDDGRSDADRWNRQFAGRTAGTLTKFGYVRIGVGGEHHMAHKIAWLFIHREWPDHEIDHIDRDRSNNAAENLRKATRSENGGNKSIHRNNTSGFKGVSWHKAKEKWAAHIRVNGKLKCLGHFVEPEAAAAAYASAAVGAFGEFATDGARK